MTDTGPLDTVNTLSKNIHTTDTLLIQRYTPQLQHFIQDGAETGFIMRDASGFEDYSESKWTKKEQKIRKL